jgi:hypothetical protein
MSPCPSSAPSTNRTRTHDRLETLEVFQSAAARQRQGTSDKILVQMGQAEPRDGRLYARLIMEVPRPGGQSLKHVPELVLCRRT